MLSRWVVRFEMRQVLDSYLMSDYLLSVMATSSHLRRINQRKIVHSMLRLHCSASRTKLAEIAGMSQATVGRIVDDLITQSILAEVDSADYPLNSESPQLGRPSRLLELDRARPRLLLIYLGVRQTRLAVVPVAIPETDQSTAVFASTALAAALIPGWRASRIDPLVALKYE